MPEKPSFAELKSELDSALGESTNKRIIFRYKARGCAHKAPVEDRLSEN